MQCTQTIIIYSIISCTYSTSLSAAPFRKGGSANHLPPIQPIFFSSSSPCFSSRQPLISSLLCLLPATSNLRIRQPSTHTEKHFRCFAGSSVVLGDRCGCGWVDTYGRKDSEYIYPLSLSGFISKKNPTHRCPYVLIANPVHPGQTGGQHFLLKAAEFKPDNIAAPATVTACRFIFVYLYYFFNTKDRQSW